jgi:hypothetical protein
MVTASSFQCENLHPHSSKLKLDWVQAIMIHTKPEIIYQMNGRKLLDIDLPSSNWSSHLGSTSHVTDTVISASYVISFNS